MTRPRTPAACSLLRDTTCMDTVTWKCVHRSLPLWSLCPASRPLPVFTPQRGSHAAPNDPAARARNPRRATSHACVSLSFLHTASPKALVPYGCEPGGAMSAVQMPAASVLETAVSMAAASSGRLKV